MRKIYVFRHGKTMQSGIGKCISQTDFPLSAVGLEQAEALTEWAAKHEIAGVYTSPLKRCVETAAYVAGGRPIEVVQELTELSVGVWEGLRFSEIKEHWPKEYEQRGLHMGTAAPPGGESFKEGGERLDEVVRRILAESKGNILIVAHSGILRGWLCKIAEISPDRVFEFDIPCGSITEISWGGRRFSIDKVGEKTVFVPGRKETQSFYKECDTSVEVQQHCKAVAEMVMELSQGRKIDRELLYVAALLHDMCRTDGKEHPLKAAEKLKKAGYERLAEIVAVHHDLPKDMNKLKQQQISEEAELLYLADKLIKGTAEVTLEERFEGSKQKCKDETARVAWQKRFDDAKRLEKKYK